MSNTWYWCLNHGRVEPEDGCPNVSRMGPYSTQEEARSAIERARERTEEMDRQDAADDDWGATRD